MNEEVAVLLITGFMDSGKTTLINNALYGENFKDSNDRILLICCEDGDEEYDEEKLKTVNANLVMIENEEDFTYETLKRLNDEYKPDTVFIEFNGTWSVTKMYEMKKPAGWFLAQSICTVDSTTYDMYQSNMRAIMNEQYAFAELVIFNRCSKDTPKNRFRAIVKTVNKPAQIVYERADGSIDDTTDLPYDINADFIEITDIDYAVFYMDCMENPKNYEGKTVKFLALVYRPEDGKLKRNQMVPGRFTMTCCADDIQFMGIKCKYDKAYEIKHKDWVYITAKIKAELQLEYRGVGPVLYAEEVVPAEKPDEELVYF